MNKSNKIFINPQDKFQDGDDDTHADNIEFISTTYMNKFLEMKKQKKSKCEYLLLKHKTYSTGIKHKLVKKPCKILKLREYDDKFSIEKNCNNPQWDDNYLKWHDLNYSEKKEKMVHLWFKIVILMLLDGLLLPIIFLLTFPKIIITILHSKY